jgi:transcriptional antiterminator RfaH
MATAAAYPASSGLGERAGSGSLSGRASGGTRVPYSLARGRSGQCIMDAPALNKRGSTSMRNWYLVHTKAGKEGSVRDQLGGWLPEVLLPTLKVRVRRWTKLVTTVAPLFPCYLFAELEVERDLARVRYTSGVREVVRGGGEPLVVPFPIVEQLKERCAGGPLELPAKPLHKGDPVTIAGGVLRDFEAVFEQYLSGPQKVAILLSSMTGTPIRVILSASSLVLS